VEKSKKLEDEKNAEVTSLDIAVKIETED